MSNGFRVTEETPDREYFTIVPNYIINHSTIWERDIYLVMKRIAGERGSCYASHQTIAEMTGVSRPTISRTIKKLLKREWIKETGKAPGKTHPTKNYIIVDLWQFNNDYYRNKKIRKPQNQSTPPIVDTSTTEPKIRKPQIHKEDIYIKKNINININSEQSSPKSPLIDFSLEEFKKLIGFLPTDSKPRYEAHNLIRRMQTFLKSRGKTPTPDMTQKALAYYFKWLSTQDWIEGVQKLGTLRLKTPIFFADIENGKYF